MKVLCIVSHREMGAEPGQYKDYIGGQIYERPDGEDHGPNFVAWMGYSVVAEPGQAPKKGGKK